MANGIDWRILTNAPSPLGALNTAYMEGKKAKMSERLDQMKLDEYDRIKDLRERRSDLFPSIHSKTPTGQDPTYKIQMDRINKLRTEFFDEESLDLLSKIESGLTKENSRKILSNAKEQTSKVLAMDDSDPEKYKDMMVLASITGDKTAINWIKAQDAIKLETKKQAGRMAAEKVKQDTKKKPKKPRKVTTTDIKSGVKELDTLLEGNTFGVPGLEPDWYSQMKSDTKTLFTRDVLTKQEEILSKDVDGELSAIEARDLAIQSLLPNVEYIKGGLRESFDDVATYTPQVDVPKLEEPEKKYTQEDLEFTAKKHGITVEEVKKRLGIK